MDYLGLKMFAKNRLWPKGTAPIAVVMISLNEGHNLRGCLENIAGWADEVHLVDSCSIDDTVDIALEFGINVVQRRFTGFGDQWNFALSKLEIDSPWVMKLDPDERLTPELKSSIEDIIFNDQCDGIVVDRRLRFMNKPLPVVQPILRIWRAGTCTFTDVAVNEHPVVDGKICEAKGFLEHFDSPCLEHWYAKQNKYTTAEAISQSKFMPLADKPALFGTDLQRRMWLKKNFWHFPFRYQILFLYNFILLGAWRAGRVGYIWSCLRSDVYRQWEYKYYEMKIVAKVPQDLPNHPGDPDPRVKFYK